MKMTSFPQIVVGTYEEFVLGYKPQYQNGTKTAFKLQQSFATHSHQASVRCVASHNHLMASSGADEYINIYDMVAMEVSTVINYHNSTVTCLEFTPDGSHLVTANQGGDIAIFRCKDWTLVKLWKEAHKHSNGVTSLSVHPLGSLLLTTGADNIVRFWNLVKGRQAYATNFSKKCSLGNFLNFGKWSRNGNFYLISIGSVLEIYKTKTAALFYKVQANAKIASATFIKKNLICISVEDGSLEIHSLKSKKLLLKEQVHKNRIKSLASFDQEISKNDKTLIKSFIVSADSKGELKLWHFKKQGVNCSLFLRGEADCGCRITCLTMVSLKNVKSEVNDASELVIQDSINQESPFESKSIVTDNTNCEEEPKVTAKKILSESKSSKRKISENGNNLSEHKKCKKLKNNISTCHGNKNSDFHRNKLKSTKSKSNK